MLSIAVLPGDGVGAEVLAGPISALRLLSDSGLVTWTGPWPVGATGFAETGQLVPSETMSACESSDAILLGAIGEDPAVSKESCPRPEIAFAMLRGAFDLRISVREILVPKGATTIVVRNLRGGAYVPDEQRIESDGTSLAEDHFVLSPGAIAEVVELGCEFARAMPGRRHVSVDKASLLATSRLWRRVVSDVAARREVAFEHVYVDRAAYEISSPAELPGVILTEGLFGDILSDAVCGRAGSPALCGSASICPGSPARGRCTGLFEPAHGSAPRRARRNSVNPAGGFLGLVGLLESFTATTQVGRMLRTAVTEALADGPWTYDLCPPGQLPAGTAEVGDAIVQRFRAQLEVAGLRTH
jgi:isocitrate/isopropylmalate dehydrogenase